jgi:hypothetical protein
VFLRRLLAASAIILGCAGSALPGEKVVSLSDCKVEPFWNSATAIRASIEAVQQEHATVLKLPGGRIDVWPDGSFKKELYISNSTEDDTLSKVKSIAFLLEDMHDLTIDGNGTLVMLHGRMQSFAFIRCTNITLMNISFDYEVPTMSEMTVISVSDTEVKVRMHPDTRYDVSNGKITLYGEGWADRVHFCIAYDPGTGALRYASFEPFVKGVAAKTGDREVTFAGDFSKASLKPGLVLTVRDHYRDNSGGLISNCRNVVVQNAWMHYMHGLGIVSQFSENITFKKVAVAPRSGTDRQIAAWADCFHFSGCRGKIIIDSCYTSGAHDDPINIHGIHLKITRVDGNKVIVRFMHHQTYGFEAFFKGDSILVTDPATLMPVTHGIVVRAALINRREMELELRMAQPDKAKEGYVIENLTWTPEAAITNSIFAKVNTRGLLVTTRRNVLIENNILQNTGMQAILIANDATSWFESGSVNDVVIRHNVFEGCGYNLEPDNYTIAISPENKVLVPGYMVHRNILVEDNTFRNYDFPVLTARSTGNLVFRNNTIIKTSLHKPGERRPQFNLEACTGAVITGNKWEGFENPVARTTKMQARDLKTDLKVIH